MFKPEGARRSLRRYRRRGLDELERRMVASVPATDVEGARVLEIGGGIGTIQAELLEAGATDGEVVELVGAYEPYAHELARDKGLGDRTSFRVADILASPASVAPADIVVLNRVVCCSPDGVALTGEAARHARHGLLVSFPRETALVRAGFRLVNGWLRLRRSAFRVFVYPRAALLGAAEAEGLRLVESGRNFVWEFGSLLRSQ